MSPFDPNSFMSQTIDAELDTQVQLVPEGEYPAMIESIEAEKDFRHGIIGEAKQRAGETWASFSPRFVLQAPEVAAELGRDKVVVAHEGYFLDLDSTGGLDFSKGKNVGLGQLREAVGQNKPGPWSFGNLSGAGPVMVKVSHLDGKNGKFARVTRVAKIA